MNKYLPTKTELSMLVIGIIIGALLTFYSDGWATIILAVPLILLISLLSYFFGKRKASFTAEMDKANNPKELLKNEDLK